MQLRDKSHRLCGAAPMTRLSGGMSGKSARVVTALTPGNAIALSVLIETIRAWAYGLRLILPHSIPGIFMSAPKLARPVTLSTPSGRMGRVPTTFKVSLSRNDIPSLPSHDCSGVEHRADDLVITGTPAKVAGEPVARLLFGRVQVLVEQRLGRDDESRRAEAALQRRMLEEFLLHRVQFVTLGDALDGLDLVAFRLGSEHQTGADDLAVEDDGAGAAIARAASFLAARQVELVTQHIEQGLLRLAEELDGLAVDDGRYVVFGHSVLQRVQRQWRPRGAPGRRRL